MFTSLEDGLNVSMQEKKRYVKKHLAVDIETRKSSVLMTTTDSTHDSRAFPELPRKAWKHRLF